MRITIKSPEERKCLVDAKLFQQPEEYELLRTMHLVLRKTRKILGQTGITLEQYRQLKKEVGGKLASH
jgi:hypothetical protein